MTDGLRIAHPQDCPLEGNPEVGNPVTGFFCFFFSYQYHPDEYPEVLKQQTREERTDNKVLIHAA